MKPTFKIGFLVLLFGVGPMYLYALGIKIGLFEEGLEMLLGMMAWIALPIAIIIFVTGIVQYFKTQVKK